MPQTPDSDKGMTFTALVRLHEANCHIDFPTEEEANFRFAVMKRIARDLGLQELRDKTLAGPGNRTRPADHPKPQPAKR